MYKEVDMRTAILAVIDKDEIAYAIELGIDGRAMFIKPINSLKLSEFKDKDYSYRYLIDEPQETEDDSVLFAPANDAAETAEDLPFTPDESELASFEPVEIKHKGGRYPKVDVGKLMALHNAGWDEDKIAGELGITRGTVLRYLREAREDDTVYGKIKALLDSGLNDVQIANELDMPRETVLRYLREEGAKNE